MENQNKGKIRSGRALASFLFPIVGIITVGQHLSTDKEKARGYGFITLASVILTIIGAILWRMERNKQVEAIKAQEAIKKQQQEQASLTPPKPTQKFEVGEEIINSLI